MTTPSQPNVESGRPSTSTTTSSERSRDCLLDGRLVERPGLVDDLVVDLDPHADGHALFDLVVAGEGARDRRGEVFALGLGEEPDVPEVDAEQRGVAAARDLGGAQDGAVAAEHDDQLEIVGGDVVAQDDDLRDRARRAMMSASSSAEITGVSPASLSCRQTWMPASSESARPVCAITRMWRSSLIADLSRASLGLSSGKGVDRPSPFCRIASDGGRQPDQILLIAVRCRRLGRR